MDSLFSEKPQRNPIYFAKAFNPAFLTGQRGRSKAAKRIPAIRPRGPRGPRETQSHGLKLIRQPRWKKMGVFFEIWVSNMIHWLIITVHIPTMFERNFFGYTMVYHGIPNFQTSRHRVIKPDSIRIRNETCPKICDATHLTAIYRWGELLFLAFISCWADVSHSILDLLILTGDRRYVQQKNTNGLWNDRN